MMKIRSLAIAFSGLIILTSLNAHSEEKKVIKLGFNPGPYKEQFEKGVAPYLIKKGYSVEYKDFNDGIQVNNAVSTGEIDGNIMQHPIYLQAINERLRIDNTGIVQVPTPPMGLYSNKHKKEDKPKDGAWISVPNQPSNEYRAALLLQSIGWIKLKEKIDDRNRNYVRPIRPGATRHLGYGQYFIGDRFPYWYSLRHFTGSDPAGRIN